MIKLRKTILALIAVVAAGTLGVQAQAKMPKLQSKAAASATAGKKQATARIASKTAYAWLTRDRSIDKGIVTFDISKPQTLTSKFALPNTAFAGAYGIDKYYFYRYKNDTENQTIVPIAFSSIDLKTGKISDIADWSKVNFICNDMTYDYTTGKVFAMCRRIYTDEDLNFDIEYSSLLRIDPKTGTYTVEHDFLTDYSGLSNPTYLTLACDMQGNMYSINIAGRLVKFDRKNDYAEIMVGPTGFSPGAYVQCMEFDHNNDKLYWAADYSKRASNFCYVDTRTGQATEIGALGNDSRIAGLYIPFDQPSTSAPAAATQFTVTPAAQGVRQASLTWTNPTSTFGNDALTSISSIKVLRAGTVIKQFDDVTPGQQMSYVDNDIPDNGLYEYSIVATNAAGDGKGATQEAWVGHDVPAAVGRLGIETLANGSASLSWDAPTTGAHAGWIDATSLKYNITRYPDDKVIAEGVTANEYTDNAVDTVREYYYVVQACNADGNGDDARTASIYAGKFAALPYECDFDTRSQFSSWYVIDNNNDESTWTFKKMTLQGVEQGYAQYEFNSRNQADDYLISPGFKLQKGHSYTLTFDYRGARENFTESFDVTFGQGRTVAAQSKVLNSYTVQTGDMESGSITIPEIDADGQYNIAFHATSPKGQHHLYITNVKLYDNGSGSSTGGLTAPHDLVADVDAEKGNVVLRWNGDEPGTSTNIFENFESYQGFTINPTGKYKWNYIDGDGCIPFYTFEDGFTNAALQKPCAAIVIDTTLCRQSLVTEDDPPYSGQKYLMFRSNSATLDGSRPVPAADDWFISPKLNFDKNFTFSFYAKSDPDSQEDDPSWKWNKEEIRVGYSTAATIDTAQFTWLTARNEVINSEWKQHSYVIPADAKYVCIHYLTPSQGYLMCLDDVFIGTGSSNAPRKAAPAFKNYNVYLDGSLVGTTADTHYDLGSVAAGSHSARVTAVYDEGESLPATVSFNVSSGVDANFAASGFGLYPNPATTVVNLGTTVDKVAVYDIATGRQLITAQGVSTLGVSQLSSGIYMLRATIAGRVHTAKLIIK